MTVAPGCDVLGPHERGASDRGDEDVRLPRQRRQIARPRVTDRHRRVAMQQQQRHRLADDIAAADDDRVLACDGDPGTLEQLDYAGWRARRQRRPVLHEQARIHRRETVDVLCRIDDVEHRLRPADLGRQRILHQDAIVKPARVQIAHGGDHFRERR